MFSTRRRTTGRARRNRLARRNHRNLHRHRRLRHEALEDRTLLSVGAWTGPGATDELLQTFHNPTPEAGDYFGEAVAAVGTDKVLIGAPGVDTDLGEDVGAAYLFDRTSGELLQTFENTAPDADGRFATRAVAAGEQYVLIAAPYGEVDSHVQAGVAYLFNVEGDLIQTIKSPMPGTGDRFGYSMTYYADAAVGEKLIIGEPYHDVDGDLVGLAYVYNFDSNTGTISESPMVLSSHETGDYLYQSGNHVAAMADGVLVGGYDEDRVNLFGWDGAPKVTFNHPEAGECFSRTFATTDDNKVIIAGNFHETSAHLFDANGTWLKSWDGSVFFGYQVGSVENNVLVSGTGCATYSTPEREAYEAEPTLSVHLYSGREPYQVLQTFTNPTPENGDRFGTRWNGLVAIGKDVLIADPYDNTGAENAGSVYLFEGFNSDPTIDTGSIRGHVFADLNENGANDDGVALPEVFEVFLDANENGVLDQGETVTTTRDRTGRFAFHNVPTGEYTVAQVPQSGWSPTTAPRTVVVNAGEVTTDVDFANAIANTKMEYLAPDSEVPFRIKNGFDHWSWFSVEESYPILDANAMLDITHDNLDIRARLRLHEGTDYTAPGGVAAQFWDAHALTGGEQLNGTVFDDEATLSIDEGSSPYDGSTDSSDGRYQTGYTMPLSTFDLEDAAGTWELDIRDHGLDKATGWCHNWSVSLTRAVPPDGESNAAPVVADDGGYQVTHGQVLDTLGVASVLDNDYDPDNPDAASDRPGLTAAVVDGPSNGSLLLRPDGSFRYLPYRDFVGTDTFTYKVSDVFSYSEEATVTIDVTSAPQPGITVTPTSGLVTTEAGGTDTFEVVLDTDPGEGVTVAVPIYSDDQSEGTVSPKTLEFTGGASGNWGTAQTVTVTGVDDSVDDGDQAYTIVTDPATATDDSSPYDGMDADDVSAVNLDDDETPGITVEPTSGLVTTEDSGSDTFSVVLDAQPSADVTIGISSSDTSQGTVDTASLTFTSTDWDTPRTVTVTGVDDAEQDGDVSYSIVTIAAVSEDSNYNTLDPADVSVTNTDNDGQVEPDVYESTDTPLDIADAHPVKGPMTTTSELVISSPDTIGSLDLVISLDDGSSDVGDLTAALTRSDSTEETIITTLASGTTTYEKVGFVGESLGGTWTLAITDSVKGNRHTLNSWSLLVVPETTSTSTSSSTTTTTTLLAAGSLEPQDSTEPVTDTSTTEQTLSSNSEPERGMAADALLPPRQLAEPSLDLLAADRLAWSANRERGDDLATDQALDELLDGMEDPDPLDDLVRALA